MPNCSDTNRTTLLYSPRATTSLLCTPKLRQETSISPPSQKACIGLQLDQSYNPLHPKFSPTQQMHPLRHHLSPPLRSNTFPHGRPLPRDPRLHRGVPTCLTAHLPVRQSNERGTNGNALPPRIAREKTARNDATLQNDNGKTAIVQKEHEGTKQKVSPRLLAARKELMRDEQVSPSEKQRVSGRPGLRASAHLASLNASPFVALHPLIPPPGFENMTVDEDIKRFRLLVEELERLDPGDDFLCCQVTDRSAPTQ